MNWCAVQVGGASHASSTNWPSISVPRGVCSTSGWNWTAKKPRSRSSIAAIGVVSVDAVTSKPGGAATTLSRWLIQQLCSVGISPNSSAPPASRTGVLPNSPIPVLETVPPRALAIACIP